MRLVRLALLSILAATATGCASDSLFVEEYGLPLPQDVDAAPAYKSHGGVI